MKHKIEMLNFFVACMFQTCVYKSIEFSNALPRHFIKINFFHFKNFSKDAKLVNSRHRQILSAPIASDSQSILNNQLVATPSENDDVSMTPLRQRFPRRAASLASAIVDDTNENNGDGTDADDFDNYSDNDDVTSLLNHDTDSQVASSSAPDYLQKRLNKVEVKFWTFLAHKKMDKIF